MNFIDRNEDFREPGNVGLKCCQRNFTMLLSRIFSLMLGTTLFVMIWSMQDGDHHLRAHAEADVAPQVHRNEIQPEHKPVPATSSAPVRVTSATVTAPESALWMFADEPAERVAGK